MAINRDAAKAVYDAVYNAAMAGKPISQGAANKIYDDVAGTAKKTTVPTNAAYSQINARTGKNLLENNAALDILKEQTAATTSSPFSALLNKSAQNANDELRKAGIYAPEFLTIEDFKTTQQKQADAQKAYDDYVNSDTYKNKQAAGATDTSALFSDNVPSQRKVHDEKEAELRAANDYYKQQVQAEEDQKVMETDLAELATWSDEDRRNLDRYIVERDNHTMNALNPYVVQWLDSYNMNPIVDKYGIAKVRQMAESLQRSRNAETIKQVQQEASNLANNNPVAGGIAGSALSVPASFAGSITSPLSYAVELGQRTGRYSTLDPNNIGNAPSVFSETVRGEVTGNIRGDENNTNWLRQLAAIGYQGGMSAIDSAARMAASAGSAGVSAVIASSGAFGSSLRQYSQQGVAPAQAAATALTNAGLEYITEKIPTEKVLDMFKKGNTTGAVKNILQQAFLVEPTSEEVNLFAGVAAEAVILGEKSSNNQRLGELIANGMSYEEAKAQIYKELWKEAAQTYAVSAVSGGLSATGATVLGRAINGDQQTEMPIQGDAALPEQMAKTTEEQIAEAVGAELAQNAPVQPPAQMQTEEQQNVENGIAATLQEAVQGNGQISNKTAEAILSNPQLLQKLVEETGVAIGTTKSENRKAVKDAVEKLFSKEIGAGVDENAENAYNNYQNNSSNVGGGNEYDGSTSAGNSAQGMARVQRGDEYEIEGRREHGGVAQRPGIVRVSKELEAARASRGLQSYEVYETSSSPKSFEEALIAGRNSDRNNGWCVTPKSAKELAEGGYRTFMNESGTVGLGVAKDGDIVAVFKNQNGGPRKAMDTAMPVAIEMGGDRLDCYGSGLVTVYENYGFIPVARVEFNPEYANDGWTPDKGTPYIYFMMHNGDSASEVTTKMHTYAHADKKTLENLPTFGKDDYDAAMEYRNGLIDEAKKVTEGVGAAEQDFSGKAQYQDLLYEGNVQPDRETDVRPMEVPKTDSYGRNVSEFVANAYGAEITPDRMANDIEMLVQEGALGFDRRSNQEALNEAAAKIEEKGAATIRNQLTRNVANGKLQDGDIEKAMLLYANYANKNGKRAQADAAEILVDLTTMAHMTGRNLQLFKLLRKLTPEGQLMAMKQTAQRSVESMQRAGLVKKDFEVELDPALVEEYRKAAEENARAVTEEQKQKSEEKMRETQQAIYAKVAAAMPSTLKAKWDAWRYMSMLGNGKTQVRNFFGNVLFMPYKNVKDKMAAVFEKALPKEQRTKSVFNDKELVRWAKEDAKTTDVNNALKYSAKLGDDVKSAQFSEGRKVFDNNALESVRKFVEKVPVAGDIIFKNDHYAKSLAGFLKARGYSVADIQNGKVQDNVMAEARGYAIQEAMKATFNDCNAFSDAIASIGRKNTDNAWGKALNIAAEGLLPFRRTPANIVVRFAEYSPAGLVKGSWDMATKVKNGDISAAAALDQIASGLTGTAVMTLGYFLAKGIGGVKLTGSGTDEDEKRQGYQDYAIEFSIDGQEYSYKIDWAAPANLPLFVGANIYQAMEEAGANTDVSKFTAILHNLQTAFEPMMALSCLSSLNDFMEGIRYAPEGEAIYSAIADVATSYFTQGIPSLVRQTYQATQKNKQATFANSDDRTVRELQSLGAQIPFVGQKFQTDKRNAWGETETTESGMARALNAYLNPGTFKQIENDAVEKELTRLQEAQPENVSPPTAKKTVNYTDKNGETHNNERLTEEQYQTLAETQGKTAKKLLDKMVASSDYQALTDAQKASAIDAVYAYAAEQGKVAALPDYKSNADTWIKEAGKDPVGAVIRKYTGKAFDDAMKSMTASWTDKLDAAESVESLEAAYTVYSNMSQATRKAVKDDATGRVAAYMEARNNRVSTETFVDLYKTYWELDKSGKKASEKAQQWAYTLERAQESGKLTEKQKTVMKDALGFGQYLSVEATKFNEMTDSGLTAKAAQDTVRAINNLLPEEGYAQVRDIQNWDAIAAMTISDTEKVAAMKTYMTDKQEQKLDAVLDMGYSVDEYPEIWRIIDGYTSGTGKKARTIAHLQSEYDISYTAAKKLYEVFK